MGTSLPPESGIPPSSDHVRYTTVEHSLRIKQSCAIDCARRAIDGLERDRASDVDWMYVYDQLTRAQEQVINANIVINQANSDDEEELEDMPLVPEAGHAALCPDDYLPYPGNGGDA